MAFFLLYVIASWNLAAFIPVLIIYLICALIQVISLKNCIIVPARQGQTQINIRTFVDRFFQHFSRPLTLPLCLSILLLFAMKDISSGQLISLFRTRERERYLNNFFFSMHASQFNPHSSANVNGDKT